MFLSVCPLTYVSVYLSGCPSMCSIQLFICIVLFTMQIFAKQLYKQIKVSTLYLVVAYQVDVHMAEMYGKNHAVS